MRRTACACPRSVSARAASSPSPPPSTPHAPSTRCAALQGARPLAHGAAVRRRARGRQASHVSRARAWLDARPGPLPRACHRRGSPARLRRHAQRPGRRRDGRGGPLGSPRATSPPPTRAWWSLATHRPSCPVSRRWASGPLRSPRLGDRRRVTGTATLLRGCTASQAGQCASTAGRGGRRAEQRLRGEIAKFSRHRAGRARRWFPDLCRVCVMQRVRPCSA